MQFCVQNAKRMKMFERYDWSRTAEKEVMQKKLLYDSFYTKIIPSVVILENEVPQSGINLEKAEYHWFISSSSSSFIGKSEQ